MASNYELVNMLMIRAKRARAAKAGNGIIETDQPAARGRIDRWHKQLGCQVPAESFDIAQLQNSLGPSQRHKVEVVHTCDRW